MMHVNVIFYQWSTLEVGYLVFFSVLFSSFCFISFGQSLHYNVHMPSVSDSF